MIVNNTFTPKIKKKIFNNIFFYICFQNRREETYGGFFWSFLYLSWLQSITPKQLKTLNEKTDVLTKCMTNHGQFISISAQNIYEQTVILNLSKSLSELCYDWLRKSCDTRPTHHYISWKRNSACVIGCTDIFGKYRGFKMLGEKLF